MKSKEKFKRGAGMKAHHILVADEQKQRLIGTFDKDPLKFEEIAKPEFSCPSGQHGASRNLRRRTNGCRIRYRQNCKGNRKNK